MKSMVLGLSVLMFVGCLSASGVTLNRFFSDNMVLQRNRPVVVRGAADAGVIVEVRFAGQRMETKADEKGLWSVTLPAMQASAKPEPLTVSSGSESVVKQNIVVGDVLLVARQSSVDISLGRNEAGKKAAAVYKGNPNVRVIVIETISAIKPRNDLHEEATTGWMVMDGNNALEMTASTFYMARLLGEDRQVPLGIVDLKMGHYFPISWMSRTALEESEKFFKPSYVPNTLAVFDQHVAIAYEGLEPPNKFQPIKKPEGFPLFPAGGYNAVLHPLRDVSLAGVLLQLGNDYPYVIYEQIMQSENPFDRKELNRAYVETYGIRKDGFRLEPTTTPRIPHEWRRNFGDQELPFGLIAPPGSALKTLGQHHREMRELQRLISEDLKHVDVIMPGMQNIAFSAQPKDDELLAQRCCQWVKGAVDKVAGEAATGPRYERFEAEYDEATIYFKQGTADGLRASGDALLQFEAADVTGDYVPVVASVEGSTIKLQSDILGRIARIRYNWNQRPDEGLVNAAGLPAFPFRTEGEPYNWFIMNEEDDLPEEYFLPANEWKGGSVTLINGQLQKVGYDNFTGWIGPAGFKTGPFGPNMGVSEVMPGSPADGKILPGDVIYSANGTVLGEKSWLVMAAAITESETRKGGGKLALGVHRDGRNLDVELQLEVMGRYSETSPFNCPKTEKILEKLDEWLWKHGAKAGFLNYDALYMLATGKPEHLARVRQIVHELNDNRDPNRPVDTEKEGKSWHNSADAILQGEYYMATGDKSVLPHLKHACDRLAATQHPEFGGWRQNFPGGATYGLIPNAGLPGVMGMHFADKAGLDIDKEAFERAIYHYSVGKAETGFLIYGLGKCQRMVPPRFEPELLENGMMSSFNGGLSSAGILMGMLGNERAAHLCSFISAYAWNNTFVGHGGNFWNDLWTPLGAHAHSKNAYINFWKHHRWYRELNRMYNGGLIVNSYGDAGAAAGLALVAPRRRLQILGAPISPFSVDAPAYLKPALQAHAEGDFDKCHALVQELRASGIVGKDDEATVEALGRITLEVKESLKCDDRLKELLATSNVTEVKRVEADVKEVPRTWECLVAEEVVSYEGKTKGRGGVKLPETPTRWRIKVLEDISQAPQKWTKSDFDDKAWMETTLPISWRMYHTVLLRATFEVDDPAKYDQLRLQAHVFRQQGIEIYLNGEVIGKINNLMKDTGDIDDVFKDSALRYLKKGKNTLAITTRHNWRWGGLFMNVYNHGFDFNLDARTAK